MKSKNFLLSKIIPAFTLIISVTIFSCSKSNSNNSNPAVTQDDAADAVTSSIEAGSGGYADQVGEASLYAYSNGYGKGEGVESLTCGVPFDTSFTLSYSGASITASISHQWEVLLTCNGLLPTSIAFTGTFSGNYDGPNLTAAIGGNRNWVITGIEKSNSAYTYNGSFESQDTTTLKVRNKNTFNTDIQIATTNVTVDKTTRKITGGAGTVTVVCTVSNGNSYSFTGTLVFNGDHTATLTINGNNYTIHL